MLNENEDKKTYKKRKKIIKVEEAPILEIPIKPIPLKRTYKGKVNKTKCIQADTIETINAIIPLELPIETPIEIIVSEVLELPKVSEVSEVSEMTEMTEVLEVPKIPEVSEPLELSELPKVSEQLELPKVPKVSEPLELPELHKVPNVSEQSEISKVSKIPEVSMIYSLQKIQKKEYKKYLVYPEVFIENEDIDNNFNLPGFTEEVIIDIPILQKSGEEKETNIINKILEEVLDNITEIKLEEVPHILLIIVNACNNNNLKLPENELPKFYKLIFEKLLNNYLDSLQQSHDKNAYNTLFDSSLKILIHKTNQPEIKIHSKKKFNCCEFLLNYFIY